MISYYWLFCFILKLVLLVAEFGISYGYFEKSNKTYLRNVSKSYFMELLRIFILIVWHSEWWNTNNAMKWKVRVLSHRARCSMSLDVSTLFQSYRKQTFKYGMEVTKIITLPTLKGKYPVMGKDFCISRNLSYCMTLTCSVYLPPFFYNFRVAFIYIYTQVCMHKDINICMQGVIFLHLRNCYYFTFT